MPKPGYSQPEDLAYFLASTGLTTVSTPELQKIFDLPSQIAQSVEEWERITRYKPFLAQTLTRTFDPPGSSDSFGYGNAGGQYEYYPDNFGGYGSGFGGVGGNGGNLLYLQCGLLSVTSLTVNMTTANPAGQVLTQGTQFWLEPDSAPNNSKPYSYIRFGCPLFGLPGSIQIAGSFGFSAQCPDDAWNAILQYAASLLMGQIGLTIHQGATSLSEGDEKTTFDPRALSYQIEMWQGNFNRAAQRYRRVNL